MASDDLTNEERMRHAMRELGHRLLHPKRCSDHHIIVGLYSFYPTTGSIMMSGSSPIEAKGLDAFIVLTEKIRDRERYNRQARRDALWRHRR